MSYRIGLDLELCHANREATTDDNLEGRCGHEFSHVIQLIEGVIVTLSRL